MTNAENPHTNIPIEYFDLLIDADSFDDLRKPLESEDEDDKYEHILKQAVLVASSEHGVVFGESAQEYVETQANLRAGEEDLIQPLYEKVPIALLSSGPLEIIPRKLGEFRGIYLAKVFAAHMSHKAEVTPDDETFGNSLAAQLLLNHTKETADGKIMVETSFMSSEEIAAELTTLQHIIDEPDLSGLNENELYALQVLVSVASTMYQDLGVAVVNANIADVEHAIEFNHSFRRRNRLLKYAGALASGAILIFGGVVINNSSDELPSRGGKVIALNDTRELQALSNLTNSLDGQDLETLLPVVRREAAKVQADLQERIGNTESISIGDKKTYESLVKQAKQLAGTLKTKQISTSDAHDTREELVSQLAIQERRLEYGEDAFGRLLIGVPIVLGYGAFMIGLLRSASRNGGRLDPLRTKELPAVMNGEPIRSWMVRESHSASDSYNDANSPSREY